MAMKTLGSAQKIRLGFGKAKKTTFIFVGLKWMKSQTLID